MASQAGTREVPPFVRASLIGFNVTIGLIYLLGPPEWSSSTSLNVAKSLFHISTWGSGFIVAGMLILSTRLWGYALAMFAWLCWWLCLVESAIEGQLTGGGGLVWPLFYLAINGYEVFRWGKRRTAHTDGR